MLSAIKIFAVLVVSTLVALSQVAAHHDLTAHSTAALRAWLEFRVLAAEFILSVMSLAIVATGVRRGFPSVCSLFVCAGLVCLAAGLIVRVWWIAAGGLLLIDVGHVTSIPHEAHHVARDARKAWRRWFEAVRGRFGR